MPSTGYALAVGDETAVKSFKGVTAEGSNNFAIITLTDMFY